MDGAVAAGDDENVGTVVAKLLGRTSSALSVSGL